MEEYCAHDLFARKLALHFSAIPMGAGKNKSKHAAHVLLLRNTETFAAPHITLYCSN
jgi:hypothetical protein